MRPGWVSHAFSLQSPFVCFQLNSATDDIVFLSIYKPGPRPFRAASRTQRRWGVGELGWPCAFEGGSGILSRMRDWRGILPRVPVVWVWAVPGMGTGGRDAAQTVRQDA